MENNKWRNVEEKKRKKSNWLNVKILQGTNKNLYCEILYPGQYSSNISKSLLIFVWVNKAEHNFIYSNFPTNNYASCKENLIKMEDNK